MQVDLSVTVGNMLHAATIGEYVVGLYRYGLGIGATLAMVMVVVGGFQYMTARGNPSAIGAAKGRITGAIIGILLLLGSYTLLQTINPQLIRLRELSVPQISNVANPADTGLNGCTPGTLNCRCTGEGEAGTCSSSLHCVPTTFIFSTDEEMRTAQAVGGAIGLASPVPGGAAVGVLVGTFVNLGSTQYRCSDGRAGSPCGTDEHCRGASGLVCENDNYNICINERNNVNGSPCSSNDHCASDNCVLNQCRGAGERLTTESYAAAGFRIPSNSQCAINGDCRQEQTACLGPGGSSDRFCFGDSAYWGDNDPVDGTICFQTGTSSGGVIYPVGCGLPSSPVKCMFCPGSGDRRWTELDNRSDAAHTRIGSCKPPSALGSHCGS